MRTFPLIKCAWPLPLWFRLTGLIPLFFFIVRLVDYVKWGTPSHIWWSCHVANLTLAVGMLCGNLLLMRLASLWLILGVPPWALDMMLTRIVWPSSLLTHLGGAVVALFVLFKVRMVRGVWWVALLWFVVLQLLSRWLTDPKYNVNAAFHGYGPTKEWFRNYWQYWLANTALAGALLWALEWLFIWLFPASKQERDPAEANSS